MKCASGLCAVLLSIALGVGLAGCDQVGEEDDALELSFKVVGASGVPTDASVVGTYRVVGERLSLKRAFTAPVTLRLHEHSLSYGLSLAGGVGDGTPYFLFVRLKSSALASSTFMMLERPRQGAAPAVGRQPLSARGGASVADADTSAIPATLEAFFLDGFGAVPQGPVELGFSNEGRVQTFFIDPAKHTLPNRPAFHADGDALGPMAGHGDFQYTMVPTPETEGAFFALALTRMQYATPQPTCAGTHEYPYWTAASAQILGRVGGFEATFCGLPRKDVFEFLVYLLEE